MALADKIKELRLRKAISLQDLATATGASKAHIWDLEQGRAKNPTIELLTKISQTLDTSIAELVGEQPSAESDNPQVMAMFRDLKSLQPDDLVAIRTMMEHLNKRKQE